MPSTFRFLRLKAISTIEFPNLRLIIDRNPTRNDNIIVIMQIKFYSNESSRCQKFAGIVLNNGRKKKFVLLFIEEYF